MPAEGIAGTDSLFFAAVPNDEERTATSACISRLGIDLDLRSKLRPASVLHATVMKVGAFESQQRQLELVKQLAGLTRVAPFTLMFDQVRSFGGTHWFSPAPKFPMAGGPCVGSSGQRPSGSACRPLEDRRRTRRSAMSTASFRRHHSGRP